MDFFVFRHVKKMVHAYRLREDINLQKNNSICGNLRHASKDMARSRQLLLTVPYKLLDNFFHTE